MKSPRRTGIVALVPVLAAGAWLFAAVVLTAVDADAQQSRTCAMNPVQQSICIYQAILADIAKTYPPHGGGGISSIVQTSTTTFTVEISQEEKTDLLNYTIKIGQGGKVGIVNRTESTKSY